MKAVLAKGREKSVLHRHPWVYSGALSRVSGEVSDGCIADVFSSGGDFLARGTYSERSQISIRVLTFCSGETIDKDFFAGRIARAWSFRAGRWNRVSHNAVRVVHGESDSLPGIVADRYGDVICVQLLTAGAERMRDVVASAFSSVFPECAVYERSDSPAREKEGLSPQCGALAGGIPDPVEICINGMKWSVDIVNGQKTGFYLDQADNWESVAGLCGGKRVLDLFCYNGGFSLCAEKHGAEYVRAVDSSRSAVDAVARNAEANGLPCPEIVCADVFSLLRFYRDRGESFDVVILDPPKLASSRSGAERACRAYKDVNLLAIKLLRPGGLLATFSCSGGVSPELFQKVVSDAALDARRDVCMIGRYTQAPDHPVLMSFPEGLYLKGILCRVS